VRLTEKLSKEANRKWPNGESGNIEWSRDRLRHVNPERSNSWL